MKKNNFGNWKNAKGLTRNYCYYHYFLPIFSQNESPMWKNVFCFYFFILFYFLRGCFLQLQILFTRKRSNLFDLINAKSNFTILYH